MEYNEYISLNSLTDCYDSYFEWRIAKGDDEEQAEYEAKEHGYKRRWE